MSESMAMYSGYAFDENEKGFFYDSSDDLYFETDPDGHCLSFGTCYGSRPAVVVMIVPPKQGLEVSRAIVRKIAGRLPQDRVERDVTSLPLPECTLDRRCDDCFVEKVDGFGDVDVWILNRRNKAVSNQLAQTLLYKIADRMCRRENHRFGLLRPDRVRAGEEGEYEVFRVGAALDGDSRFF